MANYVRAYGQDEGGFDLSLSDPTSGFLDTTSFDTSSLDTSGFNLDLSEPSLDTTSLDYSAPTASGGSGWNLTSGDTAKIIGSVLAAGTTIATTAITGQAPQAAGGSAASARQGTVAETPSSVGASVGVSGSGSNSLLILGLIGVGAFLLLRK